MLKYKDITKKPMCTTLIGLTIFQGIRTRVNETQIDQASCSAIRIVKGSSLIRLERASSDLTQKNVAPTEL